MTQQEIDKFKEQAIKEIADVFAKRTANAYLFGVFNGIVVTLLCLWGWGII